MILTAIVAIVLTARQGDAAGENSKELRAMCGLYNLLVKQIPDSTQAKHGAAGTTIASKLAAATQRIIRLNVTTIPENMKEALLVDEPPPTAAALKAPGTATAGYFSPLENDIVQEMIDAAKLTNGTDREALDFRLEYSLPLAEKQRAMAARLVRRLMTKALQIRTEVRTRLQTAEAARRQARQAAMTALFDKEAVAAATSNDSDPNKEMTFKPTAAAFPWNGNNDRDAACAKPDGDRPGPGRALAADMVCLCTHKNANEARYCHGSERINADLSTNTNGGEELLKAWEAITAICKSQDKGAAANLTPVQLAGAIAEFKGNMGKNEHFQAAYSGPIGMAPTRLFHYGGFAMSGNTPPTCETGGNTGLASAGKGVCISYEDILGKGKEIPWVTQITAVAAKIESADKEAAIAETEMAKLAAIEAQMEAILIQTAATQAPGEADRSAKQKPTATEQNKCDEFINNETECTKNDCDYDAENKKCKPKPGTGSGETPKEGAASTGCAKHGTDKNACLAEKKDDKPVCAFRTGKDGEPEPTKEMCRSSSFLLNKQFALSVVSAAFAALLF
uniref:Variant surface glycoprotein 1125.70 n=1 Tax=Trypanosoma brucei TaxID=5691 RepID=A0A1J0R472_9TRYP|nr:variant surface glycoprotein 1125.70 [Trypanosoma brucei]